MTLSIYWFNVLTLKQACLQTAEAPVMAMISNCNDRNNRLGYMEQMMDAGLEIDSFGGCLHNKDPPEGFGRDGSWMVAKQELMKQ
jgi:hypothetical protein